MNLKKRVDEYIKLKLQIEELQELEKTQKKELIPFFEGVKVLKGSGSNEIRKLIQEVFTVKPLLFWRRVSEADFIKACSISITKGADSLSRAELESISSKKERVSYKVHV